MLRVQGVKQRRGKGNGAKRKREREREFMHTLCVRVEKCVNRLFVIKRLVYFLGA